MMNTDSKTNPDQIKEMTWEQIKEYVEEQLETGTVLVIDFGKEDSYGQE